MSELKKIQISLPDDLLKEIDTIIAAENSDRNEFIKKAMFLYIKKKKRYQIFKKMQVGYEEMGMINSSISEMCLTADNEQMENYLERIRELEE